VGVDLEVVRRLVRDQWVRAHGTPRVTVIAGDGRRSWDAWVDTMGIAGEATLLEISDRGIDATLRDAVERATRVPAHPIAVLASAAVIAEWRRGRDDRTSAMVDEGLAEVADRRSADARDARSRTGSAEVADRRSADALDVRSRTEVADRRSADALDARSLAELALFHALEATPATSGRFELNAHLAVMFGDRAAEVDLLSRTDRIAIEVDGYRHFAGPEEYRRDRRKDLLLQGQGLLVVRLLADDVLHDPCAAVATVVEAMALRIGLERR
jgi:hypothetical protein